MTTDDRLGAHLHTTPRTKKPKKKRDELDRYYTPIKATKALLKYLGKRLTGAAWEPCCGKDWIGRVLREHPWITRYVGTDIDPEATKLFWSKGGNIHHLAETSNFLNALEAWTPGFLNWIVSNPPYVIGQGDDKRSAADFVQKALDTKDADGKPVSVAMLLRLTFLEPCKNRELIFSEDPPTDVLILRRVHYINADRGNNCTSAWLIWDRSKPPGSPTVLSWQDVDHGDEDDAEAAREARASEDYAACERIRNAGGR